MPTRPRLLPGSSIIVHKVVELLGPAQNREHISGVQYFVAARMHIAMMIAPDQNKTQMVGVLNISHGSPGEF